MKTRHLYLIMIIRLLLSACSASRAAADQTFALPASQAQSAAASTGQGQSASTGNTQGQDQPVGMHLPPKEAYDACVSKVVQDACNFTAAKGAETGTCQTVENQLACVAPHGSSNGGNGNTQDSTQNGSQQGNNQQNGTQPSLTQQLGDQQGNNQPKGSQPADGAQAYNIEQAISDKAQGMTISYDAQRWKAGGNVLFEKAFGANRDKIDIISSFGFHHIIIGKLYGGFETVGQDLEGLWSDEAEGGAKILVGPSLNMTTNNSRISFSLSGGPVFYASRNQVTNPDAIRELPSQSGLTLRAKVTFNLAQ